MNTVNELAKSNIYAFQDSSKWVERVGSLPFPLGTLLFLLTSKIARQVFKRVIIDKSTDSALHPIYEYRSDNSDYSIWDHRWQSSKAAQSLRFRFEWIKQILAEQTVKKLNEKPDAKIVSLGSGTGLAFIELLKQLKNKLDKVTVYFVDYDANALKRAETLAHQHGIVDNIQYLNLTSTDALKEFEPESLTLVELVGIAEYVDDEWLIQETKEIYTSLTKGGLYIGAAISSDEQQEFAHKVLRWPIMRYRSQGSLQAIFTQAGFSDVSFTKLGVFEGWVATK